MSARSYLSIGDVLTLLRQEFPDVTISKIRFLESQGLVDPERTPSGYRKFYEQDVERLRWVLRQQREHFLPLRVIKDRLEDPPGAAEGGRADADGNGTGLKGIHGTVGATEAAPVREAHAEVAAPRGQSAGTPSAIPVDAGMARAVAAPAAPAAPVLPIVAQPAPVASRSGSVAGEVAAPATSMSRSPAGHRLDSGSPEGSGVQSRTTGAPTGSSGALLPGPNPSAPDPSAPATAEGEPLRTAAPARRAPVDGPTTGPTSGGPGGASTHTAHPETAVTAVTAPAHTARPETTVTTAGRPVPSPSPGGTTSARPGSGLGRPAGTEVHGGSPPAPTSLTAEELARESGLTEVQIGELGSFGLLKPSMIGGEAYFDASGLEVARVAAAFAGFGIEARHLRLYKNSADREAGFVEQIVLPLFRQRNPEARTRGQQSAEDLVSLGARLHGALIRAALKDVLGP